jgi:hypothetical protein
MARTSALEMRGWQLRIETLKASPGELARARSLVVVAETELSRYRAACSTGGGASSGALEQPMEDLRRGVGQAGAAA